MFAQIVGFARVEDLPERVGGDVPQGVAMILIIAAREHLTIGGDDAAGPEAETRGAKGAV